MWISQLLSSDAVRRYTDALSYRDYRTLWTANLSAHAASWALIVARGWLVFAMSDSSLWVGVVTFTAMIPRVLVTPFTGYLSDRFDRKKVLASMFAINLSHNILLAALIMTGTAEVWHIVLLSLVDGSARATQMPAGQALIPNLVPKSALLNAVALNQATQQGSRLIGPAAIAPLLASSGPEGAFLLCTGFYAISLIQALRLQTKSTGEIDKNQSFSRNLLEGLLYVYRHPQLRAIVFMALFHCGLTMSFESLLPTLSRQHLNAEGAGFSYLMMAVGAGALFSALVLAGIRSEVSRGRAFFYVGILSGVSPALLAIAGATSGSMTLALASAVILGASTAGFMTLTHTMIQQIIPDGVRGRVAGVYSVHIGGTMAIINLVNGGVADYIDAPTILAFGGIVFLLIVIWSLKYPPTREIYVGGLRQNQVITAAD